MIKCAFCHFFLTILLCTRFCFIYHRMIFILFPTMTIYTIFLIWTTALIIIQNLISFIPMWTFLWLYILWISSKILSIMCINTTTSIMSTFFFFIYILLSMWTPYCFILIHPKIFILN